MTMHCRWTPSHCRSAASSNILIEKGSLEIPLTPFASSAHRRRSDHGEGYSSSMATADMGADAAPAPTPCAPCEGDDDCPSGLCVEVGLRHFCGADCESAAGRLQEWWSER